MPWTGRMSLQRRRHVAGCRPFSHRAAAHARSNSSRFISWSGNCGSKRSTRGRLKGQSSGSVLIAVPSSATFHLPDAAAVRPDLRQVRRRIVAVPFLTQIHDLPVGECTEARGGRAAHRAFRAARPGRRASPARHCRPPRAANPRRDVGGGVDDLNLGEGFYPSVTIGRTPSELLNRLFTNKFLTYSRIRTFSKDG
jgi:hypothetical protein